MHHIEISPINQEIGEKAQYKLDNKAKPIGSLGQLEKIALQVCQIQDTTSPKLQKPTIVTVAGDHGVTQEGVSPCPTDITWQQVLNFLNGGGGIGLFANHYEMDLVVVDAGVDFDFSEHPKLIDAKIARGTENLRYKPAMTVAQGKKAIENGRKVVYDLWKSGCNVVGFGEMGIGNTTPASALLSIFCNHSVEECTGPGSGLSEDGVSHKVNVIKEAIAKHGVSTDAIENLARFGGFEIATIAGGMLEAAARKMIIITDGFITTSALLVAHAINPLVLDYAMFSHESHESGHKKMIDFLGKESILSLGLRLGEGTGAAMAYSLIKASVAMINEMTSFEQAKVHNTTHIRPEVFV